MKNNKSTSKNVKRVTFSSNISPKIDDDEGTRDKISKAINNMAESLSDDDKSVKRNTLFKPAIEEKQDLYLEYKDLCKDLGIDPMVRSAWERKSVRFCREEVHRLRVCGGEVNPKKKKTLSSLKTKSPQPSVVKRNEIDEDEEDEDIEEIDRCNREVPLMNKKMIGNIVYEVDKQILSAAERRLTFLNMKYSKENMEAYRPLLVNEYSDVLEEILGDVYVDTMNSPFARIGMIHADILISCLRHTRCPGLKWNDTLQDYETVKTITPQGSLGDDQIVEVPSESS